MRSLFQFVIRSSAFFRKEIVEVLRQPRLILTLALGPFLILLVFGLGYNNQPRAIRTLFVADPNSAIAQQIKTEAPTISPQLVYAGIEANLQTALTRLSQGDVEMVIQAPQNAYQEISNNQQASFQLYHNELDPAQASYVEYLGQIVIDEVNRRVLAALIGQGQAQSTNLDQEIKTARENIAAMRAALQIGDVQSARRYQSQLNTNVSNIDQAAAASAILLSGIQENTSQTSNAQAGDITSLLSELKSNTDANNQIPDNQASYTSEIDRLNKSDANLAKLQNQLTTFKRISPEIMVRPFKIESHSITAINPTPVDFFTPAVIVLLLQHVAVTIAALSIVRESSSGTMELFRVSPVTPGEAILGKYVSYLVFGAILSVILILLMYYGLHIPMLGSWQNFAIVVIALLFASLGVGFIISLLAETESQAVQMAMIALLVSVFFSGFLLDLRYFWTPVKVISYLIPATYGNILLKDVMLRGAGLDPIIIGGLTLMGIILFILAWILLNRRMARR